MKSYINNISRSLSSYHKCKVVIYGVETDIASSDKMEINFDKDLDYLYKNNDPRIYEKFLDFVDENEFDKIFIPRLTHPEYFFSELRIRTISPEVVFSLFAFELFSKSKARRELLTDLICSSGISRVLIHSILGGHLTIPFEYRASEVVEKIKFVPEPVYESEELYGGLVSTSNLKPKILYFGNMFYGKGVDLLLAASGLVKNEMEIVIAGDFGKKNFDFNSAEIIANDFVQVLDGFIEQDEMIELFRNCDAVVLPYRKTYEYGTSGVFVQAMLAGKPVLVPDIYPFNYSVETYSCGLVFKAENVVDLARGLDEIVEFDKRSFKTGIIRFRDDLISWDQLTSHII